MLLYNHLETFEKTNEESFSKNIEKLLRESLKIAIAFCTGVIITLATYPSGHQAFGQTDSGSVSDLPFMGRLSPRP